MLLTCYLCVVHDMHFFIYYLAVCGHALSLSRAQRMQAFISI